MNTKESAVETKVETVDHRSTAGEEGQAGKEKVGVVHLRKKDSGERPGVLASATAAVSNTFKSAKEAIMGKGKPQQPGTTDPPQ
ncbi:unnamed protein product [Linum trigynum]|uniref:Uncharacterized protein n=1 Tax=Linum trigynum TaxID=586398 RepID=A0AAV2FE35_9ROSI